MFSILILAGRVILLQNIVTDKKTPCDLLCQKVLLSWGPRNLIRIFRRIIYNYFYIQLKDSGLICDLMCNTIQNSPMRIVKEKLSVITVGLQYFY